MADCDRHRGVVAEEARRECVVCLRNLHRSTVRELVRTRRWRCFYQVATIVLAIALFAGCTHAQRRTTSTVATSTASVEAHREERTEATQQEHVEQQRKVHVRRVVTPGPNGQMQVDLFFEDWRQLAGQAQQERKETEQVGAKAATEDKSKVDDVKKEPPSLWDSVKLWLVVIVVLVIGVGVTMAYRRIKRSVGR